MSLNSLKVHIDSNQDNGYYNYWYYEIKEKIGSEPFSSVYRAIHQPIKAPVTI
jgi:hypothetical protein